ncbi:MAG: DUF3093 domain-containing protein [Streptosporangiaceae bacterium]|jgi:hypothetical protein|nr:hypothetical protein [Actinomycetota bacterium]
MRNYRERLWVPVSYWLLGLVSVFLMATILWGGFSLAVGIGVYIVLMGGFAATLAQWGRATIEVSNGELRAGRTTMRLAQAGEVVPLDAAGTRALRGPQADPAAFMLTRPYLRLAVYIEVAAEGSARPYWLIGSRDPAALAAAIERSRPQAHAGGTAVG